MLQQHIFAGCLYGLLSATSLILYILFFTVVFMDSKLYVNPYYKLAISLGISDVINMLCMLLYATPCSILQVEIGGGKLSSIMGTFSQVAWYVSAAHLPITAYNRFTVLVKPSLSKHFDGWNVWYWIVAAWVIAAPFGIINILPGCHVHFYPADLCWGYELTDECAKLFSSAEPIWTPIVGGVTILMNLATFNAIRSQHNVITPSLNNSNHNHERAKRERTLFFNFTILVAVFITTGFTFNLVPSFVDPFTPTAGMIVNTIYLAYGGGNPFVYLFGNSSFRKGIRKLFYQVRAKIRGETWAEQTFSMSHHLHKPTNDGKYMSGGHGTVPHK